jgi:hypothetical protein
LARAVSAALSVRAIGVTVTVMFRKKLAPEDIRELLSPNDAKKPIKPFMAWKQR